MARLFLMTMLVSESVLLVPVPVLVVLHFLLLRRSLPGLHFAHSAANGLSYVRTVPSGFFGTFFWRVTPTGSVPIEMCNWTAARSFPAVSLLAFESLPYLLCQEHPQR